MSFIISLSDSSRFGIKKKSKWNEHYMKKKKGETFLNQAKVSLLADMFGKRRKKKRVTVKIKNVSPAS